MFSLQFLLANPNEGSSDAQQIPEEPPQRKGSPPKERGGGCRGEWLKMETIWEALHEIDARE